VSTFGGEDQQDKTMKTKLDLPKEFISAWIEHLKALTTLSSALIVAIIGMFQLSSISIKFVSVAAFSLGFFFLSIIGSVLAQMILLNIRVMQNDEVKVSLKRTLGQSLFVANIFFLIAVLLLTIFGVSNVIGG
jgi:uncharacterized membrane protein